VARRQLISNVLAIDGPLINNLTGAGLNGEDCGAATSHYEVVVTFSLISKSLVSRPLKW
jgi:hypothetical protein